MNIAVVYIAGPITAPTEAERIANCQAAIDLALELFNLGIFPVVPHFGGIHWWGKVPEPTAIVADLAALDVCHGLVLSKPGWEHSRGTVGEILHAVWSSIPCWEPGRFLAGPLDEVLDRSTPGRELLARAKVPPHPASLEIATPEARELARSLPVT